MGVHRRNCSLIPMVIGLVILSVVTALFVNRVISGECRILNKFKRKFINCKNDFDDDFDDFVCCELDDDYEESIEPEIDIQTEV